jgi:phosphonate transport system ATP-binding protein
MLELKRITRRFGANTAVDSVDLTIPQGQMVGVIGSSGAGKSTLLRLMALVQFGDTCTLLLSDELKALRWQLSWAWTNCSRDATLIVRSSSCA